MPYAGKNEKIKKIRKKKKRKQKVFGAFFLKINK